MTRNMAALVREQAQRAARNVRHAFRAVAANNTHCKLD